jgi:protein subunit release factor A
MSHWADAVWGSSRETRKKQEELRKWADGFTDQSAAYNARRVQELAQMMKELDQVSAKLVDISEEWEKMLLPRVKNDFANVQTELSELIAYVSMASEELAR